MPSQGFTVPEGLTDLKYTWRSPAQDTLHPQFRRRNKVETPAFAVWRIKGSPERGNRSLGNKLRRKQRRINFKEPFPGKKITGFS